MWHLQSSLRRLESGISLKQLVSDRVLYVSLKALPDYVALSMIHCTLVLSSSLVPSRGVYSTAMPSCCLNMTWEVVVIYLWQVLLVSITKGKGQKFGGNSYIILY